MLLYEMLAGRSPFDVVGATDNPDQNTEDYLFQGELADHPTRPIMNLVVHRGMPNWKWESSLSGGPAE